MRVTLAGFAAILLACSPALSAPPAPGGSEGKTPPAHAAPPSAPAQPSPGQPEGAEGRGSSVEANKEAIVPDDASASRNAARTRMRECGHQWSGMKKSGAANGMTWKEFSQVCLARK